MASGETRLVVQRFSIDELEDAAVRVLAGFGAPLDLAELTARSLAQSNLLGHDSHGIIRLLQYAAWVRDGQIRVTARPEEARRLGATALVDGNWGFGQPTARMATDTAIELVNLRRTMSIRNSIPTTNM